MNLNDKVKGAIVGFAFGDALGLGTEFMTRREAATYYPDGLRKFSQLIRDAHRVQWKRGEWTNDTDIILAMFESVLQEGRVEIRAQARALRKWLEGSEVDMSPILSLLCRTPGWEESPITTAHRIWHDRHIVEASNEAINRSVITGIGCKASELAETTRRIVLMTNDDSRCVASTMVLARLLNDLFYNEKETPIQDLLDICHRIDPRTLRFVEAAYSGDIDSLDIDDEATMCWTRKTMAAALWGFWHGEDAADSIYKVIALGGDADTNAAMAGALVGVKYGYDALPAEKENIVGLDRLMNMSDRLTRHIEDKII